MGKDQFTTHSSDSFYEETKALTFLFGPTWVYVEDEPFQKSDLMINSHAF